MTGGLLRPDAGAALARLSQLVRGRPVARNRQGLLGVASRSSVGPLGYLSSFRVLCLRGPYLGILFQGVLGAILGSARQWPGPRLEAAGFGPGLCGAVAGHLGCSRLAELQPARHLGILGNILLFLIFWGTLIPKKQLRLTFLL